MANILFIDDDQLVCKLFESYFLQKKITGTFVNTAEAGWDILKQKSTNFQVAIIDILLPGMSGLELLKRIKLTPEYRDLPCIVLTGIVGDAANEEAKNHGAIACFFKDHYTPQALVDEVIKLVPSLVKSA